MKNYIRILSVLFALLLTSSGVVGAQSAPPPVTGVAAQIGNGEVVVQWDPIVSDDAVAYYRVYFSGQSILNNDGLYDDFEATKGNETTLIFTQPEEMEAVYVAVIAVAESGLESEYFIEEGYAQAEEEEVQPTGVFREEVDIGQGQGQGQGQTEEIRLLRASVPSPEEIAVEFSGAITVDPALAPNGLRIETQDGENLHITRISITGASIVIHTETQTQGVAYNVLFSEPFKGKNGLPLHSEDRSVFVAGHSGGIEPSPSPPSPSPSPNPKSPPDLTNVSIASQVLPSGLHTVTLEWDESALSDNLYGIIVYQTRDGDAFAPPDILPANYRGAVLQEVTPGLFGVYLQTIDVNGSVSHGVFVQKELIGEAE